MNRYNRNDSQDPFIYKNTYWNLLSNFQSILMRKIDDKMRDMLYYNISEDGKTIQLTEEPKGKGNWYKGKIQYAPVFYMGYIINKIPKSRIKTLTFTLQFKGLGNLVLVFTMDGVFRHTDKTLRMYCDNGRGNRFALQIISINIEDRENLWKRGKKIDIVFKTSLPNCFQMSNIASAAIERKLKKGLKF